jgi:hypothetical protein
MLVLLTTADTRTAIVPLRHTPSLTDICAGTGLDRATVQRHLNRLERAGWLRRCRPPVAEARRLHSRTGYHCQLPGLGAEDTLPRCAVHLGLGAERTPGLGAQRTSDQNDLTDIRSRDVLTARVIELVQEATGKTISDRDAARGIKTKLDGRRPRDAVAYLAKVIATDPGWWLPTPTPPAYKAPAPRKVDA